LGNEIYLKGDWEKAIKFYEKALAIDKEFKNKKVSQPVIIILVLFILIWVSMRKLWNIIICH